ncbi:hypothetical protein V2G26_014704 [Clonostachys chloroleuca]
MISARTWRGTASCGHNWPPNQVGLFSKPNCRLFSYVKQDSNHTRAAVRYFTPTSAARWFSSPTPGLGNKRSLDLDTIVSVLEVSATKRDAKSYLQKYTSKENTALTKAPNSGMKSPRTVRMNLFLPTLTCQMLQLSSSATLNSLTAMRCSVLRKLFSNFEF